MKAKRGEVGIATQKLKQKQKNENNHENNDHRTEGLV